MANVDQDNAKKKSIDDIIEHMTADFQRGSYEGQYLLLGPPSNNGHPVWTEYAPQQPPPTGLIYPQMVDNREMIGMMDVGGGNYVNVVLSKNPNQEYNQPVGYIHYQQTQNLVQPHYYGQSRGFSENSPTNGCLIENVVGNWAPNHTGTYSPFGRLSAPPSSQGGVPPGPELDQPRSQDALNDDPPPQSTPPAKKHRIVAEVKPLRPTYSDVLAKSVPPLTPPPMPKHQSGNNNSAPKAEQKQPSNKAISPPTSADQAATNKHKNNKNAAQGSKEKGSTNALKRQSSSGSEESILKNGIKRWSSMEELSPRKEAVLSAVPAPPRTKVQETTLKVKKKKQTKSSPVDKEEKLDYVPVAKKSSGVTGKDGLTRRSVGEQTGRSSVRSPPEAVRNLTPPPSTKKPREERKPVKPERACNPARAAAAKSKGAKRSYKKRESTFGQLVNKWREQSSYYVLMFTTWLWHLLWDVAVMSTSLLIHMAGVVYEESMAWARASYTKIGTVGARLTWWKKKKVKENLPPRREPAAPKLPGQLQHNIQLPTTGEEAMKRLLSCKGKDPYSILGVTNSCTDEEIKRYYKSQALLVHPDKNPQPGAEEAFKILVHAFELIAEPEKREAYDRYVAETNQVEQAWSELSELLTQLHEKMEYAANTIRCNNCGKRHKREMTDRPVYAARYCAQCKIHHSAKEGDMWAEVCRGWWLWGRKYFAVMDGAVYEITEWAECQGPGVRSLQPHSHHVQYRVLLGGSRYNTHQHVQPEPDFEDLLNSLYSQNGGTKRTKKRPKRSK